MDELCNLEETMRAHRKVFNPGEEEEGIHGQES